MKKDSRIRLLERVIYGVQKDSIHWKVKFR